VKCGSGSGSWYILEFENQQLKKKNKKKKETINLETNDMPDFSRLPRRLPRLTGPY
jgi:hypothetical protein